ncbi:MAG: tryptophan-rich sensory protein [Planctomycetes bacterium]|nr:tryptophan-rich sensory protein [Planctomycetota bacterium]
MSWREWYDALQKPSWTPQPATIGTIWQLLYPIILVTFTWVFFQTAKGKLHWSIAVPFVINPIVFTTLLWAMVAIWPHSKWIALLQIPYLIWVSIAKVLQMMITAMNSLR